MNYYSQLRVGVRDENKTQGILNFSLTAGRRNISDAAFRFRRRILRRKRDEKPLVMVDFQREVYHLCVQKILICDIEGTKDSVKSQTAGWPLKILCILEQ